MNLKMLAMAPAFALLAACGDRVPPPEWTNRYQVSVSKRSCTVTRRTGESVRVKAAGGPFGTDTVDAGVTAYRAKSFCYLTGTDGTECAYDRTDKVSYCRKKSTSAPSGNW